jgi:hypothetical protein
LIRIIRFEFWRSPALEKRDLGRTDWHLACLLAIFLPALIGGLAHWLIKSLIESKTYPLYRAEGFSLLFLVSPVFSWLGVALGAWMFSKALKYQLSGYGIVIIIGILAGTFIYGQMIFPIAEILTTAENETSVFFLLSLVIVRMFSLTAPSALLLWLVLRLRQ